MSATKKTKVKRRSDGTYDKGHHPANEFVVGNKGGGRQKGIRRILKEQLSDDEAVSLLIDLARSKNFQAIQEVLNRKFGKIPDINIQIKLQRTEIVHKVGDALSQALLQNGISKETAVLVVDDMETIIEGGEA